MTKPPGFRFRQFGGLAVPLFFVMAFTGYDFYISQFVQCIDETIVIVNASGISVSVFQAFRLSFSLQKPVAANILQQVVDPFQRLFVFGLPLHIFMKSRFGEGELFIAPLP